VKVEWDSLGCGTGFVALLDGSADVGASSRPISAQELEEARIRQIELREFVIGYDAIAIIVHPSNPLEQVSIAELADLFTRKQRSWSDQGGARSKVQLISRPAYSGTYAVLASRVLGSRGDLRPFERADRFSEDTEEIVRLVSTSPRALSYASLAFVESSRSKVKILPIATEQGAIEPSLRTIRDGSYPFYRPLYLYTRGEPTGKLRDFMAFVFSEQGQERVARAGFASLDLSAPPQPASTGAEPASTVVPVEEPRRIQFAERSTALRREDRAALNQFVEPLRTGTHRLRVIGHADGLSPARGNLAYSLERAEVIASYLRAKGVPRERIETIGRGEAEPLATNTTAEGRKKNRRVDLLLLPAPRDAAAQAPDL
jgi:phosphate transport system substrate-binding protein